LILFWGNAWSDKMSNQKLIGLEGTIKAYAGDQGRYADAEPLPPLALSNRADNSSRTAGALRQQALKLGIGLGHRR
jgi:hypothetical protein